MIVNRQFSENNSALDARLDELAAVTAELLAEAVDQGIKTAPNEPRKASILRLQFRRP